jgi:hypothetical protein
MKTLKEQLTESSNNSKLLYDLQMDIYNALANIAYAYDMKNKKFEEKDVRKSLDWFMDRFFEENDED